MTPGLWFLFGFAVAICLMVVLVFVCAIKVSSRDSYHDLKDPEVDRFRYTTEDE